MKLKKIGALVLVFALIFGSFGINDTYAMGQQEHILVNINHHIITPFWSQIDIILPDISASVIFQFVKLKDLQE